MAAGDTLLVFETHSAVLPTSGAAGLEVVNYRPVIAFDAAADESVMFESIIPWHAADAGGYEVRLTYAMESTNTDKEVMWQVDWENLSPSTGNKELDSDHFTGSPLFTNPTVPVAAYEEHTVVINFTKAETGEVNRNHYIRLKATREGTNVADTAAGDAYLLRTEVRVR